MISAAAGGEPGGFVWRRGGASRARLDRARRRRSSAESPLPANPGRVRALPTSFEMKRDMAAYQYIYTMKGLTKVFPSGKKVLEDIWLSFLPGAKIGVLGLNGAGKSTLLKIMAGLDKDFAGDAQVADGVKVGFLSQEPQLDPKKTVQENVIEGLAPLKAMVDRFDEVSSRLGEVTDDDEMNALLAEQAELQEKIDAANAWELQRTIDIAMDALRCPPGDAEVTKLSGGERRRVALCRLLLQKPDMLLLDEPTNHLGADSVPWLERFLHDYPGTVVA